MSARYAWSKRASLERASYTAWCWNIVTREWETCLRTIVRMRLENKTSSVELWNVLKSRQNENWLKRFVFIRPSPWPPLIPYRWKDGWITRNYWLTNINLKKRVEEGKVKKQSTLHLLLYHRLLLDDLVLEFEGQDVQYVDSSVVSGEQKMKWVWTQANGRHRLQLTGTSQSQHTHHKQTRNSKGRNPHRRTSWKLVGNPGCELVSN